MRADSSVFLSPMLLWETQHVGGESQRRATRERTPFSFLTWVAPHAQLPRTHVPRCTSCLGQCCVGSCSSVPRLNSRGSVRSSLARWSRLMHDQRGTKGQQRSCGAGAVFGPRSCHAPAIDTVSLARGGKEVPPRRRDGWHSACPRLIRDELNNADLGQSCATPPSPHMCFILEARSPGSNPGTPIGRPRPSLDWFK